MFCKKNATPVDHVGGMQKLAYQALRIGLLLGLGQMGLSSVQAGPYDQSVSGATAWLSAHQNPDGSWGNSPDLQPIFTSVAVRALANAYDRQAAYFLGVTWLENHAGTNVDATARKVGALADHGDSLTPGLNYLQTAQTQTGSTLSGWGLSGVYSSSPIDTALALLAVAGIGGNPQTQPALDYLRTSQRTGSNDQGWAINNASASDPTVTALVIQALSRYTAQDSRLPTVINNALATLNTQVTATAPPAVQALAAQAAQSAGNTSLASTFLTRLTGSQAQDGSWANADPYTTALATRALATANYSPGQDALTNIPDQALRRAINLALGRNAGDSLNRGELAQLTSLSAVGAGISDLTGLEFATNLKTADFSNNNIVSTAPLNGLTQLTTLKLTGNPVATANTTQVPDLPPFAQWLLAAALLSVAPYHRYRTGKRRVCQ